MSAIRKIVIANRGEIAVRIIKSAKRLSIKTVSIYSDLDRASPHVLMADEAFHLPGKTATETYLDMHQIVKIAKKANADAIHPGYGFLSENAAFANLVESNGLKFIGPSAKSIKIMGNKIAAKEAVSKFQVPLVPGDDKAIEEITKGIEIAEQIGFPILIKAAAGGGGKGMRVVNKIEDFNNSFKRAVSEAKSAFGDGSVFIEKYIEDPKHIEVQILADNHGNIIHLFERECSIQRRHQKVMEEAPSPTVNESLREALGKAAIDVAKSCQYTGAGTVEFIMDTRSNFYFLEMNTRLQVEHPVTEFITGIDLVEQQIKIAEGHSLQLEQANLTFSGHAIELRVYAEDAQNNFLPSPGKLVTYSIPTVDGIRVDDGVLEGSEISVFYDPMISKLIAYGKSRKEAIEKLLEGIEAYVIEGVQTTLPFGKFVLKHPSFIDGSFNTHFVEDHYLPTIKNEFNQEISLAGKVAAYLYNQNLKKVVLPNN